MDGKAVAGWNEAERDLETEDLKTWIWGPAEASSLSEQGVSFQHF